MILTVTLVCGCGTRNQAAITGDATGRLENIKKILSPAM